MAAERTLLVGKLVPWSQAVETEFDLAISASHGGSLERLRAPLLLTFHGIGFTKTQTVPEGGVPPLPRRGSRAVPRTTVVLSHGGDVCMQTPCSH